MSAFQTDSLNPSALPSSTLGRRRAPAPTSAFDPDPSASSVNPDVAARERFHEEWNVRIDKEVKALAGGLKEIVDQADIGPNPSAHSSTPQSLHLRLRTAQLIRSAQSIRDMAHELRLMLLLSDEVDMARRRDIEVKAVREELQVRKGKVDREIRGLMGGKEGSGTGGIEKDEAPEQPEPIEEVKVADGAGGDIGSRPGGEIPHSNPPPNIQGGGGGDEDEDDDDFEEV